MNKKKPMVSAQDKQSNQADFNDQDAINQEVASSEQDSEQQAESEAPMNEDQSVDKASLLQEVEQLKQELAAARDQQLRGQAEIENIRRRAAVEQKNARKFAVEDFANELLSVRDSLNLAQKVELTADNEQVIKHMQEGLGLTLKQLDSVFNKFSISVICPEKGDKLNPEHHQAMSTQLSNEVANNCILNVILNGYKLHDRLLRPAMVIVAKADDQKSTNPDKKA